MASPSRPDSPEVSVEDLLAAFREQAGIDAQAKAMLSARLRRAEAERDALAGQLRDALAELTVLREHDGNRGEPG